ncbi:MAG: DarT ssDNA thymidine ADP-ribosyltransferase family protein [Egibacteraceae bacterium]
MQRSLVHEVHFIAPHANVASILELGILSHQLANQRVPGHTRIDNPDVQQQRDTHPIWTGTTRRSLLSYANLYIHARNAMLYKLLDSEEELTVLAVDSRVLDLPDAMVTDRNAAAYTRKALPAHEGLAALEPAAVLAMSWKRPDASAEREARQRRMAEVLVPDLVPALLIRHAYVPDQQAAARLRARLDDRELDVRLNECLFFRGL